ncbi:MAG: hypothetical protein F7C34_05220 [Desulfurococcales archaeon]|nr:hypothetical protein [Desulfurococcales archaeon]
MGNRMHGDDGIGPCLAYALLKCSDRPKGLSIFPLDLPSHGDIALFEEPEVILLVDATPEPGVRLYRLEPKNLSDTEMLKLAQAGAGHSISPITLVALAASAGLLEGKRVYLLALGPLEPSFGRGLSDRAIDIALKAIDEIIRFLESHGCEIRVSLECVHSLLAGPCSDPLAPLSEASPEDS